MVVEKTIDATKIGDNEKGLALFAHIGFMVVGIFAPFAIAFIPKHPFVRSHGRAALNWTITAALVWLVCFVPFFLVDMYSSDMAEYVIAAGLLLFIIYSILSFINWIRACKAVLREKTYKYFLVIPFFKV
jgi:uncharacterized Tic20 family protein